MEQNYGGSFLASFPFYVPVNSNCDQSLIPHRQEFDVNLSPPRRAFDSVCGRTKLVGGCMQKICHL
jgi:hypothetical protein